MGTSKPKPLLEIREKLYRVQSIIGKGGFAKVFKAINVHTSQEVAIKKIKKTICNEMLYAKLNEEAMNQMGLNHENILDIYDCYEDSLYIYLVLELCPKGDLAAYLHRHNRKRVSEAEACTIAKQVLDGLLYLHSCGMMHRDLKLANILVTENNRIKIADFGLSTRLKGATDIHKTMCGTPNFMSPEVAAQAPHGPGVDMWGLGAVLYTLICGEPPFKTHSISSTLAKVRSETLKIPEFVSPEARDILFRLLEKNQVYRISAEQARNHAFFRKYPDTPLRCNTNDSGLEMSGVPCADCYRSALSDATMSSRFTCSSFYNNHEKVHPIARTAIQKSSHEFSRMQEKTNSWHGDQRTSSSKIQTPRPENLRNEIHEPVDCPHQTSESYISRSKSDATMSSRLTPSGASFHNSLENIHRNGSTASHNINHVFSEVEGQVNSLHGDQRTWSQVQMTRPTNMKNENYAPSTTRLKSDLNIRNSERMIALSQDAAVPSNRNSTFAEHSLTAIKNGMVIYGLSPIYSDSNSSSTRSKNASSTSGFVDDPVSDRLPPPFISTKRLQGGFMKTERGFCSIKGRGEAVLEMPVKGTARHRYYVVTPDQYMISYVASEYVWPPPSSSSRHHCAALPSKWLKIYSLVRSLVDKIKSKTVKIALHSDLATSKLMESSEHFVLDLRTGEKMRKAGERVTLERPGQALQQYSFSRLELECGNKQILELFLKQLEKCQRLERELDENLFPISCGRRALALK